MHQYFPSQRNQYASTGSNFILSPASRCASLFPEMNILGGKITGKGTSSTRADLR
jgi:hypothetical protein